MLSVDFSQMFLGHFESHQLALVRPKTEPWKVQIIRYETAAKKFGCHIIEINDSFVSEATYIESRKWLVTLHADHSILVSKMDFSAKSNQYKFEIYKRF